MRAGVVLAVLLASVPVANAFAPHKAAHDHGSTRVRVLDSVRTPRAAAFAFATLAQRGWKASWDRDTSVPAWLWGSYVDAPGAVHDADRAEQIARAFLAAHLELLAPGASPADFTLVANQLDGELRSVGFQQTWRGMRVVGGQLGFVIAHDRLFAISSSAWPRIDATVSARRTTSTAQRARAVRWIAGETGVSARARATGERVIVPAIRAGNIAYEVADVLDVEAVRGPERWDVYVAADGTPLRRTSKVMFASAKLAYNAGVRHGAGARADYPAAAAQITVNTNATTTAADGSFTWGGTAPSTVAPGLAGTFVRIINQAGPLVMASLVAQPAGTVTWNRATDEVADAQLSTFIYANLAKARARIVNPSVATWLDTQLDFFVNETGSCNAYSTGNDVHLYRGGSACQNTGRLADVVFHEFGHSLHNNSVINGMGAFESNLSEGLADFFAANITGDPAVGRGFYKSDEPLRQIDPVGHERVYPADLDFDPHLSGMIIGGALWDLRKALIASLGAADGVIRAEKIFTGIMQRANDIGTTFMAALIADDDDADLGNGTPNFCAIERAFGTHGLVAGYEATTIALPAVTDLALGVTVTTPVNSSCPPPAVTSVIVTWRANDGVASELALVTQDAVTWTGAFPEHDIGTVLAYSVDVHFDDGSVRSFPNNPADPRYQLFVGTAKPIWCEGFDADPQWPQTSNLSFEWQWAAARADAGTPDPDAAFTGTHVLGTDVSGDGMYRPNMIASISTPPIDVSAFEIVRLHYWRWLTVEDAMFDEATIAANTAEVWSNASSQNGTLDHVDREWRFHDIDLSPHVVDGTVELRWGLSSDFGKELGGWTLDDVCIVGLSKVALCGDGELDAGEQCDDGNTDNDDGCTSACIDEVTAGGGGCCSSSGGRGSLVVALGVLLVLRGQRRRRSSSLLPSRSVSLRMP